VTCTCPGCGARYTGTGGGHCMACHRTFTSVAAADRHRVGGYDDRRCVDLLHDIRTRPDGSTWQVPWRVTARGWTPTKPRPDGTWGTT